MSKDVNILHHLGLISRNLGAMANQFESLGFTLTPATLPRIQLRAGGPTEPIGVANRCAIFRNNYLELLGVVDASLWASIAPEQRGAFDIDRPLSRYEGLHVLHLGADDLDVVRGRLETIGIPHLPIRPYERLVDTPGGKALMRARSMALAPEYMPEALFQIAQHETPELVLQTRYMQHANGAESITEVIVCVDDAEAVSERYAAVAGKPVQSDGGVRRVRLGDADILVTDPAGLRELLPGARPPTLPFLAGLTLAADIATTVAFFKRNGIPAEPFHGHLVVGSAHACGAVLRFRNVS